MAGRSQRPSRASAEQRLALAAGAVKSGDAGHRNPVGDQPLARRYRDIGERHRVDRLQRNGSVIATAARAAAGVRALDPVIDAEIGHEAPRAMPSRKARRTFSSTSPARHGRRGSIDGICRAAQIRASSARRSGIKPPPARRAIEKLSVLSVVSCAPAAAPQIRLTALSSARLAVAGKTAWRAWAAS